MSSNSAGTASTLELTLIARTQLNQEIIELQLAMRHSRVLSLATDSARPHSELEAPALRGNYTWHSHLEHHEPEGSSAGLTAHILKSPDPVQKLRGKLLPMVYRHVDTDISVEIAKPEGSGVEIESGVQSTTEFKS